MVKKLLNHPKVSKHDENISLKHFNIVKKKKNVTESLYPANFNLLMPVSLDQFSLDLSIPETILEVDYLYLGCLQKKFT